MESSKWGVGRSGEEWGGVGRGGEGTIFRYTGAAWENNIGGPDITFRYTRAAWGNNIGGPDITCRYTEAAWGNNIGGPDITFRYTGAAWGNNIGGPDITFRYTGAAWGNNIGGPDITFRYTGSAWGHNIGGPNITFRTTFLDVRGDRIFAVRLYSAAQGQTVEIYVNAGEEGNFCGGGATQRMNIVPCARFSGLRGNIRCAAPRKDQKAMFGEFLLNIFQWLGVDSCVRFWNFNLRKREREVEGHRKSASNLLLEATSFVWPIFLFKSSPPKSSVVLIWWLHGVGVWDGVQTD